MDFGFEWDNVHCQTGVKNALSYELPEQLGQVPDSEDDSVGYGMVDKYWCIIQPEANQY